MTTRSSSVVVFAGAVMVLAACAANGSRASFDEAANEDNAPAPADSTPPPAKTSQSGTVPPPAPPSAPPPPPTDAGSCTPATPTSKCGLVPQCGCTLAETCDVADSAGNTQCVTAGTATEGKPCTTTAGCARGLTCVFGTCHELCNDTSKACTTSSGTGGACINVQTTGGGSIPGYDVCLVKCDLRDASACGGTTAAGTGACMADDKGNTDCEKTTGNQGDGQTCTGTDCAPGLVCVSVTSGGSTSSLCKKWCLVGSSDCGTGKTCGGFATKMMVDGKEYGACP